MKGMWLLSLYPRAWRRRYADEFAAVLEQSPTSLRLILDSILGAIDAHLWLQASAAGPELAAKAAGGGKAMLADEFRGRVIVDPSLAIGVVMVAIVLAMVVMVAISPHNADTISVYQRFCAVFSGL
jgi:hypothetical protein